VSMRGSPKVYERNSKAFLNIPNSSFVNCPHWKTNNSRILE
jgi:hypothetical protein